MTSLWEFEENILNKLALLRGAPLRMTSLSEFDENILSKLALL
jgi:hypothetical protein